MLICLIVCVSFSWKRLTPVAHQIHLKYCIIMMEDITCNSSGWNYDQRRKLH